MTSAMTSAPRFRDASGAHQARRLQHSPLDAYPGSTENPRLHPSSLHQQRSFAPSPDFSFDFRLETDSDILGGVKSHDQVPHRQDEPLDFALSAFPESARTYCSHPFAPAPLQIPSQTHPAVNSPTTYIPSATSSLASQSFPDFPPSSDSHSLSPSPLERTAWTDHSSSSLSLSPHDGNQNGAPDLPFDARMPHIPFLALQSSQPSLQVPVLPDPRLPDPRRGTTNGHTGSPDSGSSESPDFPRPKIGPNGLAEDQPPTAQGKMRTRVYVACLQCRSRKIRCDGGKPKCLKCTRRTSECQYDSAPKRRGPDKKPGARQRTSKKAKASKDGAPKSAEGDSDAWGHVLKGSDEEESEPRTGRKRRKATDGLPWSAGGGGNPTRRNSATTTSSAEVPSPLRSRGVQDPPVAFDPLLDLPDASARNGDKEGHIFNQFVGSRVHMQPSSHDRSAFSFDLSTGTTSVQIPDPPPISHRQQQYTVPSSTLGGQYFPHARIDAVDEENQQEGQDHKRKWDEIAAEPSLEFSRKTWWDSLLAMYSPGSERTRTTVEIHGDLQFLFKSSNYFVSFFNVQLFFTIFCNPAERDKMQPSLVLAGLALATFMRSSEINLGNAGRMRALWLRDQAQSALEASFNAQWIDPTLAQAAWLLALFEMCAHPYHSSERSNSAMVMLDSIIHALRLTMIDVGDPNVSTFPQRAVPVVSSLTASRALRPEGCSCNSLTLGQHSRISQTHTPLWAATPAWNEEWSVAEIRKEESRRLCWSTLQLAAGHTAHAAAFSWPMIDFYCVQPANYALLFPGESLMQSARFRVPHSGKQTVWALYSRAMLLWNSCLRMREEGVTDDERARYAVGAWIESTAIEEALDAHTCGCDQAFMYQGREFLFITRMCISYEFRRFIPHPESDVSGLFNRKKAMAWLVRQSGVAKRIMHGLHTVTGHKNNVLAQRPFFVWWFMSLVARSLVLFSCDPSLLIAIEVCQAFLPPIEYLSCLWPCPTQRTRYRALHARLTQACRTAGLPPPPPPNFDILSPGSPPMNVI